MKNPFIKAFFFEMFTAAIIAFVIASSPLPWWKWIAFLFHLSASKNLAIRYSEYQREQRIESVVAELKRLDDARAASN